MWDHSVESLAGSETCGTDSVAAINSDDALVLDFFTIIEVRDVTTSVCGKMHSDRSKVCCHIYSFSVPTHSNGKHEKLYI